MSFSSKKVNERSYSATSSSSSVPRAKRAPSIFKAFWPKYLAVPGLLLTTGITTLLVTSSRSHWAISDGFYNFVISNRASTQIAVQIFAALLAGIHTYALCTAINFSARIALVRQGATLDNLRLWDALSSARLDLTLGKGPFGLLICFYAITIGSAALWAGAITPVVDSTAPTTLGLSLPQFSNSTADIWLHQDWMTATPPAQNAFGTFSYSPVRDVQGLTIVEAGSASTLDGSPPFHSKNDKSGYLYQGRSFGVGVSPGLVVNPQSIQRYEYEEFGYKAEVKCQYNTTATWGLKLAQSAGSAENQTRYPNTYMAKGNLPNGNAGGGYPVTGLGNTNKIMAVGFKSGGKAGRYDRYLLPAGVKSYIGITAGQDYLKLDKIQCEITVIPTKFNIVVNVTNKVIVVTPADSSPGVKDIDPTGTIAFDSANSLLLTSLIYTSFWTSAYGNALLGNIENVLHQKTSETKEEKTMRGIAESFQSMVDNYLCAFSSAQLMIANDTLPITAKAYKRALVIGQNFYIYSISAMNAAVLLIFAVATIVSGGWKDLPRFDFRDLKSVMIGTSIGGSMIGNLALDAHWQKGSAWIGDASDKVAGGIRVFLKTSGGLAVVAEQKQEHTWVSSNAVPWQGIQSYPNAPLPMYHSYHYQSRY